MTSSGSLRRMSFFPHGIESSISASLLRIALSDDALMKGRTSGMSVSPVMNL